MKQWVISNNENDYVLARKWFLFFCIAHFIVWILAPTLIYQNPPTDSLEGIAWGNLWLWGYEKHPFLAPWLSALATDVFAVVGWPIYFLSQLCVVACFWATWRLANKMLQPWQAFIAVVLLEGINYYNIQSAIFDPNVLMLPFWALLSLFFYKALLQRQFKDWLWVGLFAGLALVSKYESGLLFILLFVIMLITPEGRKSFKTWGIYAAIIIALLIFLPNFIWLYQHHFDAVNYAVAEMANKTVHTSKLQQALQHTWLFIVEQIGNIAPLFLLYLPFYNSRKQQQTITHFTWRFILVLALGPTIFTVLLALFDNAQLVSRWSFPFFSLLPVLWLLWRKPEINVKKLKLFALLVLLWNIILLVGMVFYFLIWPLHTGKAEHSDTFPGKNIAMKVTQEWHNYYQTKLPYIAGTHHVVVNVAAFSSDKPIAYFDWSLKESPWINEQQMQAKGAVFVFWLKNGENSPELIAIKKRFPSLQHESIVYFNRLTKAKVQPVAIWIAFLPPHSFSLEKLP